MIAEILQPLHNHESSMFQGTTRVLKLFALLVFSFELLTPLLLSEDSTARKNQGNQLVNAATTQNQILCLIAEEFDSGEESGEGHKECAIFFDFDLVSVLHLQMETNYSSLVYIQHTYESSGATPQLFLLNSVFLI
jgi:hypothetical protein